MGRTKRIGEISGWGSITLHYEPTRDTGQIKARDAGGWMLGELWWNSLDDDRVGRILLVDVNRDVRRRGLATAMLTFAREIEPRVHHSENLSQDGVAWSQKVAYRLNSHVPDVADYYVTFKRKGHDEATARCYAAGMMLRAYVPDERLSKTRTEELIHNVLDDYGQGRRIMAVVADHVSEDPDVLGEYMRTPGNNHVFLISSRKTHTVLHEIAHALDPNVGHGQSFNVLYTELLERYHRRGREAAMEYGNQLYLLANAIRAGKCEPQAARRAASLTGQRWFHGSNSVLKPGDLLVTGESLGWANHDEDNFPDSDDYVHFTNDPIIASYFGSQIYEVEPTGMHQVDPEMRDVGQSTSRRTTEPVKVKRLFTTTQTLRPYVYLVEGDPEKTIAALEWGKTAGANGDLPPGMKITDSYRRDPDDNPADPGICWVIARISGEFVGSLTINYDDDPATIFEVTVEPQYRRRGVATALLEYARQRYPSLRHSDVLTDDGRAWSQRVAGANGGLPEGIVLDDFKSTAWGPERYLSARVDGEWIGSINWNFETGTINTIAVEPKWRRRGIASYLFEQAKRLDPTLHHSTDLTGDGVAWKRTLTAKTAGKNGDLPEGLQVAEMDGFWLEMAWDLNPDLGRGVQATVAPHRKSDIIGVLTWETRFDGRIDKTWVHEDHRRKGIATALLAHARSLDPRVHHSYDLSPDGRAWSQKTAMPVGPPPPGVRYLVTTNSSRGDFTSSYNMLGALLGDEVIGLMTWGIQGRKIQSVWVKQEYRRRRIAETMLALAKSVDPGIAHHVDRTDAGDSWARAVTPDSPDRQANSTESQYGEGEHGSARTIRDRLLDAHPREQRKIRDLTPVARDMGRAASLSA